MGIDDRGDDVEDVAAETPYLSRIPAQIELFCCCGTGDELPGEGRGRLRRERPVPEDDPVHIRGVEHQRLMLLQAPSWSIHDTCTGLPIRIEHTHSHTPARESLAVDIRTIDRIDDERQSISM